MSAQVRRMHSDESRASVRQRYGWWNQGQMTFANDVSAALDARIERDTATSNGASYFLQAEGGTGKTYLLNVLQERTESKGHISLICASTGKAVSIYEQSERLHSLHALAWRKILSMLDRFQLRQPLRHDHREPIFFLELLSS